MRIIMLIFGLLITFQIVSRLYINYNKSSQITMFYDSLKKDLPSKSPDGMLEIYDATLDKNLITIDQRYLSDISAIPKGTKLDNAQIYAKEISCNQESLKSFFGTTGAEVQYNFYSDDKTKLVHSFKISKDICQSHSEQYSVSKFLKKYIDQLNEQLPETKEDILIKKIDIEDNNTIVASYKSLEFSSQDLVSLTDEDFIQIYSELCTSELFPYFISKGIQIKIKTYSIEDMLVNVTTLNQIVCARLKYNSRQ